MGLSEFGACLEEFSSSSSSSSFFSAGEQWSAEFDGVGAS